MKRKLIEVALPLEAINAEAAREKSIRHGHPSTLHLWWSRKPLAACRAVLFASLVDDPSSCPDLFPTEEAQDKERQRLFVLIERLVKWENIRDERLYREAWEEILKSTDGSFPLVLDPFAGGGSIPLEAQRLGLEAHASDLNPVAVLINKALIEIPPKFAGRPPVNPKMRAKMGAKNSDWKGAQGLAEDLLYYGEWMRKKAVEKIGYFYPTITIPADKAYEAAVIAWLWARTVSCPNPACGAQMPLVNNYWLSKKKGKEAWVNPKLSADKKSVQFEVYYGKEEAPAGTVNRNGARCACCGAPVSLRYIRNEGKAGRMGAQLMAIVAEGAEGRAYFPPNDAHIKAADVPKPKDFPAGNIPDKALGFSVQLYGMTKYASLFTSRQLTALTTLSDLVGEAIAEIEKDARLAAEGSVDERRLDEGGSGAKAYSEAVGVYLACAVSKAADMNSSFATWVSSSGFVSHVFTRQALSMVWGFAEANPFSDSSGSWNNCLDWVYKCIKYSVAHTKGFAYQQDAAKISHNSIVISTDPPYYDNIGYADLSDFFYIWLRRSLHKVYPKLFSTMLVPKTEELIAASYRFNGDKEKAKAFFESGMLQTFKRMREAVSQDYPLTVYYAYKQTENKTEIPSSGWETMLQALIKAGFSITGTWPLRTERPGRTQDIASNALASSIAIVCRPRADDAAASSRRAFLAELRETLKTGLHDLQSGNIAPVDLAQASIGPGIAAFSKYKEVLEADGSPLTVRQALILINKELDVLLGEQTGSLDGESQFCVSWFEQYGFQEGPYGDANTLMRARMADEQKLKGAAVLQAGRGKVRLMRHGGLDFGVFLKAENNGSMAWAVVVHLCRALADAGGLERCAALMAKLPSETAERVKVLAYRIYQICNRKGWAEDALAYNNLVAVWGILENKTREAQTAKHIENKLSF
ncbi:MAG: DUF1156 domain-containing protein [Spirochaetaceae bacterium]|jgi:putative DNA methylase|nr:DUF1156 domain-containing protein [Spirochaetaceae bacterium]